MDVSDPTSSTSSASHLGPSRSFEPERNPSANTEDTESDGVKDISASDTRRVRNGDEETEGTDICRVCRCAGETTLYHPCLCTGSIKYIHQECLLEWLKYSKKEVCELCRHKYSFRSIYVSDMPLNLPFSDILQGILKSTIRCIKTWAVYVLVCIAWLGVVPLTATRVYRTIFSANSLSDIFSLPFYLFSMENILVDCFKGCFIVSIFLCTFVSLIWLREQINAGGQQEWLNLEIQETPAAAINGNGGPRLDNIPFNADNEFEGPLNNPPLEPGGNDMGDIVIQDQGDAENWHGWERFGEELTLQRILGLDGSLLFLEHVFWVIVLNVTLTLCFAFIPFCLGNSVLSFFGFHSITYFPTPIAILLGYVLVSFGLRLLRLLTRYLRFPSIYRMLGICYLMLKVFLLTFVEIGFFPVICGWWLDLCSLPLFATTFNRRIMAFKEAPYTSLFMHWLFGMIYAFYSSSFVLILREILRSGVLWFIRNLNDPDFNPIQEMIDLPIICHLRRMVASVYLFFTTIILVVYIPLKFISRFLPSVLPFNFTLASETPLGELSLELLVLQIVLPALLEQTHARSVFKVVVLLWCKLFGRLLNLERYLLPENPYSAPAEAVPVDNEGLAGEHQALFRTERHEESQLYLKPPYFAVRIVVLLLALAATSVVFSTFFYVVPVLLGRYMFFKFAGLTNVHEFYTVLTGMYACFLVIRSAVFCLECATMNSVFLTETIKNTFYTVLKLLAIVFPVLVVIPLLTGICFQLSVVNVLRVARFQTALFFPWQHWAMGVLQWKLFCALVAIGPDWHLKVVFNRVVEDGIRELRLSYLYQELVAPILASLTLFLTAPYVVCGVLAHILGLSYEDHAYISSLSYPCVLILLLAIPFLYWQCAKIKALELRILNEKYLIQTELVNYEKDSLEEGPERRHNNESNEMGLVM
uniref:RING-type E3 ubiquitin transferase n=1 Tax=Syphacia muris TaxID=451379 RepID=A0A0N5A933_9BILA